jgi:hypothetical protein
MKNCKHNWVYLYDTQDKALGIRWCNECGALASKRKTWSYRYPKKTYCKEKEC